MTQSRDRKILRVGIIQNGKIIEERLLRKRESVTVGQSHHNTFVLPSAGLPRAYKLFDLRGGVYHLRFRNDMGGKVSVSDAVLDFNALREQKLARQKGELHILPLSEKSRGKILIADVTLLFQFVSPPPPPSKLQLPASARGGWAKSVDWTFVSFLMASFVLQVFSLGFILSQDYPKPPTGIESLPDRFIQLLVDDPSKIEALRKKKESEGEGEEEVEEEEVVEEKPKAKAKEKAKPKPKEDKGGNDGKPLTKEQIAQAKEARRRRMSAKVQSKTILGQLGALGGGDGEGTIVDSLQGGAAEVTMAAAFDGAGGLVMADQGGASGKRRRNLTKGSGQVAGIKDKLRAKGGGSVRSGKKGKEKKIKGRMSIKKPSEAFGTGVLDSAAIARVVRRRQGAVKSCYEKQLKKDPKLAGKVKVQFTIEQSGRVGKAKVIQNTTGDTAVGRCITSKIRRWRFPKPNGGSVTVAFPFVFAPASR